MVPTLATSLISLYFIAEFQLVLSITIRQPNGHNAYGTDSQRSTLRARELATMTVGLLPKTSTSPEESTSTRRKGRATKRILET